MHRFSIIYKLKLLNYSICFQYNTINKNIKNHKNKIKILKGKMMHRFYHL